MSSLGHDIYHGIGIARIELRRSLRKSFRTRKRKLAVLGFVALFSPTLFFWGSIAYDVGKEAMRQGKLPIDLIGVQLSLLVVVFVVMGALRVVQQGRPEGESLLLTATSPRAVLIGQTVHSTVQLVGFVLFPTVLFAGAFALGAGQPSVLLTAVLAVAYFSRLCRYSEPLWVNSSYWGSCGVGGSGQPVAPSDSSFSWY